MKRRPQLSDIFDCQKEDVVASCSFTCKRRCGGLVIREERSFDPDDRTTLLSVSDEWKCTNSDLVKPTDIHLTNIGSTELKPLLTMQPVDDGSIFVDLESDVETVYSVQSKVTEIVKDSTDDLWFLETDDNGDDDNGVYVNEFEVPSDVESLLGSDSGSDFISKQDDIIIICQSESDLEFFADCEESDIESDGLTDDDLSDADKWTCTICSNVNYPLHRFCDFCWTLRPDWLPNSAVSNSASYVPSTSTTLTAVDKALPISARSGDVSFDDLNCNLAGPVSQNPDGLDSSRIDGIDYSDWLLNSAVSNSASAIPSTSTTLTAIDKSLPVSAPSGDVSVDDLNCNLPGPVSQNPDGLNSGRTDGIDHGQSVDSSIMSIGTCVICMSAPKDASLIHGSSGHQACCFRCAKQLKQRRRPCPVCRRPIQRVIKNYVV